MTITPRSAELRPVRSYSQTAGGQQDQHEKQRELAGLDAVYGFAGNEEQAFVMIHG
jgi:hypothetical protein